MRKAYSIFFISIRVSTWPKYFSRTGTGVIAELGSRRQPSDTFFTFPWRRTTMSSNASNKILARISNSFADFAPLTTHGYVDEAVCGCWFAITVARFGIGGEQLDIFQHNRHGIVAFHGPTAIRGYMQLLVLTNALVASRICDCPRLCGFRSNLQRCAVSG